MNSQHFATCGASPIGTASDFAHDIHLHLSRTAIFEDLNLADLSELGRFMPVYEAPSGCQLIREGEISEFMILVISGSIDVTRKGTKVDVTRVAVVHAGRTLGEVSMLDGELRLCSCVTLEACRFAVMTRAELIRMVGEAPALAAKILLRMSHVLARRLRNANMRLSGQHVQDNPQTDSCG